MKKLLPLVFCTSLFFLKSLPAQAREDNPPVVNGRPCIEEVCLGDEVKDLGHIQWVKVGENQKRTRKISGIGDNKAIKIYALYSSYIDAVGLKAFNQIKGFCKNPTPDDFYQAATYFNKKKEKVEVSFRVEPTPDGSSQKFVVSKINRTIYTDKNLTREQLEDIDSQIKQKYPSFYGSQGMTKATAGLFTSIGYGSRGNDGGLYLVESRYKPGINLSDDAFRKFPGCGGDERIKI